MSNASSNIESSSNYGSAAVVGEGQEGTAESRQCAGATESPAPTSHVHTKREPVEAFEIADLWRRLEDRARDYARASSYNNVREGEELEEAFVQLSKLMVRVGSDALTDETVAP